MVVVTMTTTMRQAALGSKGGLKCAEGTRRRARRPAGSRESHLSPLSIPNAAHTVSFSGGLRGEARRSEPSRLRASEGGGGGARGLGGDERASHLSPLNRSRPLLAGSPAHLRSEVQGPLQHASLGIGGRGRGLGERGVPLRLVQGVWDVLRRQGGQHRERRQL